MFIASLFTTPKRRRQPKGPPTNEWPNKLWSVSRLEYFSAVKKNDVLIWAAAWTNLENIMLSERSPSQNSYKLYVSIFMTVSGSKTIGTEQINGCPGLGWG